MTTTDVDGGNSSDESVFLSFKYILNNILTHPWDNILGQKVQATSSLFLNELLQGIWQSKLGLFVHLHGEDGDPKGICEHDKNSIQ
jgi:hypothetical protein